MRHIFLTIIALLISSTSYCQELTDLSLQKAQELALAYNKSIEKAKTTFDKTGFDVEAYKSHKLPRLDVNLIDFYSTASGSFTINGGNLPTYVLNPATGTYVPNVTVNADGSYTLNEYAYFPDIEMKLKIKNVFLGSAMLTQPIYTGGKISSAIAMAEIGQQIASVNIRLTEDQVIVATDEAYINAVRAKEMHVVAESYHTMLLELERTVDSAVRHGLRLRNDLMKVQVKLNESDLAMQKASNGYLLARMNLCHLTGIPLTKASSIEVDTQTANKDRAVPEHAGGVEYRPEYTILEKKADLAREEVRLTRSDFLPNVALFGVASYANGGELAGKRIFDNFNASVGIAVKVPVLNFGEKSSKVRSAKAKVQLAELDLQDNRELMELEIEMCKTQLSECHTEVDIAKRSFDQASENLRISKSAYDNGVELLSDYFDAQAQWKEAAANVVEARCSLFVAYTKLLKATGQLR